MIMEKKMVATLTAPLPVTDFCKVCEVIDSIWEGATMTQEG